MQYQQDLEEEIDVLEYAYDNLEGIINVLKGFSSEGHQEIMVKAQELLNDIDYELMDKEDALDELNEIQLRELRCEKCERELEYQKMKGF